MAFKRYSEAIFASAFAAERGFHGATPGSGEGVVISAGHDSEFLPKAAEQQQPENG